MTPDSLRVLLHSLTLLAVILAVVILDTAGNLDPQSVALTLGAVVGSLTTSIGTTAGAQLLERRRNGNGNSEG